jgi:hypothetical protein
VAKAGRQRQRRANSGVREPPENRRGGVSAWYNRNIAMASTPRGDYQIIPFASRAKTHVGVAPYRPLILRQALLAKDRRTALPRESVHRPNHLTPQLGPAHSDS